MKTRRKLLSGEGVEVRSTEEGFVGSWHAGNVFSSDKGFRIIEYHHILSDNSSCERLLESVPVSNFIEGEGVCDDGLGFNYRGLIRPMIRPLIAVNFSQLNYGECVDVYYKDAWWEGVIFDRCVGDMDRIVFFPDMGDVMRVGGNAVRVSQDWDEWSGKWRVRGKWVFLELFDEFEKEFCPFLVSVKQIWYDVRVNKGFEESVKEWTCCRRELWRGVLLEVVMEYLKISMQEFLKTVDFSEQEELEESYRFLKAKQSDLYGLMKKSKGFDEISEDGVVSGVDSARLDTELLSSSVKTVFQHEISCGTPMKLGTVPSYMDDKLSMNESCNSSCKVSEKSKGRVWVSGDIVPEYCADAIKEYSNIYCKASKSRRDLHAAELNLRKHLVFLGWKAEYFQDKGFRRWRYAQPNGSGKYFSSLLTVCKHFKKSNSAKVSVFPQYEQNRSSSAADITVVTPLYEQSHGCNNEQITDFPDYYSGLIEPEYCPQAVINYYSYVKKSVNSRDDDRLKDMQLRAKKHLSAVGWKLYYTYENNMRSKELSYSSPCGKLYVSLRSACQGFLDEKRNVVKLAEAQLLGKSVCSALETKEYQVKHEKKRKCSVLYPGSSSRSAKSLKKKKNLLEVQSRDKSNYAVKGRVSGSRKRAPEIVVPSAYPTNPRTVLSWLIEKNVIRLEQGVQYIKDGKIMKKGKVTCHGIRCDCCQKIFTVSNFEVHNIGTRCQPSVNICLCLPDGKIDKSLHECQMKLRQNIIAKDATKELKAKKKYQDKDDDICSICHSWGQLICCDGCPSAFHERCLGLKEVPGGNWYCPSCCCKICGLGVKNGHTEVSKEDGVMNCHQCNLQYHIGCLRMNDCLVTSHSKEYWFCSKKCENISFQLENRLGKASSS